MRDINEYTGSILRTAREEAHTLRQEAAQRRETLLAEQRGQLALEDARKREELSLWLDKEYAQRLAHRRRAVQKELSRYKQQLMAQPLTRPWSSSMLFPRKGWSACSGGR